MKAVMLAEAEREIEEAFDYYQLQGEGLGMDLLEEFRRGVDRILENPDRWQQLDYVFRRYRLHRFPYGLIYKISVDRGLIEIQAVMHMSRKPGYWQQR
ncbi:MAG TPA: type II toxin-antitoxin system RelE/ParE family toxin [Phycisphaerae bacterium]|nr:type II toxin-antitoxin system RelE/ParE family toxin [Phycisphaerae bacterium]